MGKSTLFASFLLFIFLLLQQTHSQSNSTGYSCSGSESSFPCQTFAFYRASSPSLPSIANLFGVSPLSISKSSNISSPFVPLLPGQPLLIPITCSCNPNTQLSSFNTTYQIKEGDTFFIVATNQFQNLSTYQAVELANPTVVPTNLTIGTDVVFPIFCQCPNKTQLVDNIKYLITYVFQPSDTYKSIAAEFGSNATSLAALNGENATIFSPILVPVSTIPSLRQPRPGGGV